jgi:transposase
MLLVGYIYGIKPERHLTEDIALNLVYRWFCVFNLTYKMPNYFLFSQNRRHRFTNFKIFNKIFKHIVRLCIEKGIVTGESVVRDCSQPNMKREL